MVLAVHPPLFLDLLEIPMEGRDYFFLVTVETHYKSTCALKSLLYVRMGQTQAEHGKQAELFSRPYGSLKVEVHGSFYMLPRLTIKSKPNLERRPPVSEPFLIW